MNRILKATNLTTSSNRKFLHQLTRMSSNYLINDPKYAFLKELGLTEKNNGVFSGHGRWFGDGKVIESFSPVNNKPIASVVQGNVANLLECIEESQKAWEQWADVSFFLVHLFICF